MIYRNDMAVAEENWGRGGNFLQKVSLPFPDPHPLSSKTFDFIDPVHAFGEWREVVFVNEESAVLKILGGLKKK